MTTNIGTRQFGSRTSQGTKGHLYKSHDGYEPIAACSSYVEILHRSRSSSYANKTSVNIKAKCQQYIVQRTHLKIQSYEEVQLQRKYSKDQLTKNAPQKSAYYEHTTTQNTTNEPKNKTHLTNTPHNITDGAGAMCSWGGGEGCCC